MKISVITVCFNAEKTVAQTMRSVAQQSYGSIEHIVVDGASTDGTLAVVERYGQRIAKLVSERDRGIYDAMNKGLALASGEIIGFLNADDVYANSGVLARIAHVFKDPEVEACYGDLVYVSVDGRRVVRYWKSKPFEKGSFAHGWCPPHPTFYIRRSALERLGPFDQTFRIAADVEFMMRYLERGGVRSAYIPKVQVRMRMGGVTNRSWRNIVRQNQEIIRALKINGVPFSVGGFLAQKVANRLWQRIASVRAAECG